MLLPVFVVTSLIQYVALQNALPEILRPVVCRLCECKNTFWKHGSYSRRVIESGHSEPIRVFRFLCSACLKTVSRPWEFIVPHSRYTTVVVEAAIQKYVLTRISYRKIAQELAANDSGDRLPPSHVQIFNWVKCFAKRSKRLGFKLQKELALRGLFRTITDCDRHSICPNAHQAHTKGKADLLSEAHALLSQYRELSGQTGDVISGLQTFFLTQIEHCEAILSGRVVCIATPHNSEQIKRNSRLDCLSATAHRGQNFERERTHKLGEIPLRSDSAVDTCELGESSTERVTERDIVASTFESGWG